MDSSGILPDALDAAIHSSPSAQALYLNPTVQNPTTLTIPRARRIEIADVLLRHRLPLIETTLTASFPPRHPCHLLRSHQTSRGTLVALQNASAPVFALPIPLPRMSVRPIRLRRRCGPCRHAITHLHGAGHTMDRGRHSGCHPAFCANGKCSPTEDCRRHTGRIGFQGEPEAFNIWLKTTDGSQQSRTDGTYGGTTRRIMPSDAFTVSGIPDEHVRVCLGGIIQREELRASLLFMSNSLSEAGWMG